MSTETRDGSPVATNGFDDAMRRLHADALAQVSAPTRARLRAARTGATGAANRTQRGVGWALASGFAAVFAVVIGLQLRAPAPTVVAPSPIATTTADNANYDIDTAVATLDENPDLYLWLAANDDSLAADLEQ
ncbi:MAG TPA: hypothetical protein VGD21_07870 [Lysobacter sp.]